ncbi:ketopantoate reductase C-terminal domain-containing protein [uncultured Pontibacter sp.]|uniref:ketopantoate reductase family protein n=1 Tax=uncultured Pontibacter sp. TaxID=453356 RepID=UPI002637439D|nr:ketopantoate reductase C-terminal domain-containing protein [uncultured Pontibacter sp.]
MYIISSIKSPGVVQVQGKYNRLVWGNPKLKQEKLEHLKWLFDEAGINHEFYGQEVEAKVWEKFSFISPVASLTSLTHKSMGSIMANEELKLQLQQLMQELVLVAKAKGINLPLDMVERNLAVVEKLPQEATSSMERDFASGNRTELENLTGYIVREAEKFGLPVPQYQQVYEDLRQRQQTL